MFPPGNNQKGEVIPKEKLNFVLYTKEKCGLPIVHAKEMRKAIAYGVTPPDVGCWGRTLSSDDESIVIIGARGDAMSQSLSNFVGVDFQSDGSTVITVPSQAIQEYRKRFPAIR